MFKRINVIFLGNVLSKASTFAVMLYTLHVIAKFNDLQTYALWAIITSITSLAVLFDFGIGSFLTNALSSNKGNLKTTSTLLQNGLFQVLVLGTVSGLIINIALILIDYFEVTNFLYGSNRLHVVLFFAVFLSILQSAITRICYGLSEANVLNGFVLLFNIISCVAIYKFGYPDNDLSDYILISLILPQLYSVVMILYISIKYNAINKLLISKAIQIKLIVNGFGFWLMQLSGVISLYLDPILIGAFSNEENVVAFNSIQKYFLVLVQIPYLYSLTLWPTYSILFSSNRFDELKNKFINTLKVTTVMVVLIGLPVSIFWGPIIRMWLGSYMNLTTLVVLLYFILVVVQIYGTAISIYFNGCGIIRVQVFGSLFCVILLVPLKIYFISYYGLEIFLFTWLVFYLIYHMYLYRYMFNSNKQISPAN